MTPQHFLTTVFREGKKFVQYPKRYPAGGSKSASGQVGCGVGAAKPDTGSTGGARELLASAVFVGRDSSPPTNGTILTGGIYQDR
jgi:hypothetical protein